MFSEQFQTRTPDPGSARSHAVSEKPCRVAHPGDQSRPQGTIAFDLVAEGNGTRLKLSHRVIGAINDDDRETYTHGWQELLGEHLKRLVEQRQGYREA
jgi:hypothetical protein